MTNHHCQNASVPQHLYGHVDRRILTGLDESEAGKYENAVFFGVTSIPSRGLHFSILCESGAQWARIPIHMLYHELPTEKTHPIEELQMWDCHGWDFSVTRYDYLREMACEYRQRDGKLIPATYWFTLDHTENGYSLYPPEHKCYHLLLLDDGSGQIAAQPNNRILWKDDSFVGKSIPTDYKVMAPDTWHAEISRINAQDTAMTKD
jgi:hypothetical protein